MTKEQHERRLSELDAAIAVLYQRQAAQPAGQAGFARRARLAVLIAAFMRRRDLVLAALAAEDDGIDGASEAPKPKRRET